MKNKRMITKSIVDVVSLVIISLLFYHHQYFLGVFFLIMFIEFSFEYSHLDPIRKEVAWIKSCLAENSDKQHYINEHNFYIFVISTIDRKEIKKGMHIDEIYKILNNQIEIWMKNSPRDTEYNKSLKEYNDMFFQKEGRGQDESVDIHGYLVDPLTIRLHLRFRNNKLLSWEYLGLE